MPLNWLPLHYFVSETNKIINRPNHKHTSHTGTQIIHVDRHIPHILRILFRSDTVVFDLSSFPPTPSILRLADLALMMPHHDWLMMPHHVPFPDAISLASKNIAGSSVPCSVSSVKHPCSYHQLFQISLHFFPYITYNISCLSINEMNRVSSIFSL